MAGVLCINPIALRGCIFYKFIKGKEPFETYTKMMKMFGDEFMTYPEFEFWYMRFAQGNFDLDCDFSLEPKKRKITDLPVEIFEKVGDSLYFEDRIQLRLVSEDIQFRVDNWNPKVTKLYYGGFECWNVDGSSKTYIVHRSSYSSDPLVKLLKNPKLRLKKLTVYPDEEWMKIEQNLRESSTKLHVSNFIVDSPNATIDFRILAPESLEEVTLRINDKSVKKMNEILQSEHCKQLKMLTISTDLSPSNFPFGSFIGYPRFTIKFHEGRAERKISQFIKKLIKCTQLELCKLESAYYDNWVNWESIGADLRQIGTLVPDSPNLRRYPIQGSTDFYEINIERTSISIERKY